MKAAFKTGIDVGGTKIEVVILNISGKEIYRHRIAAPQGSYSKTLKAIKSLVETADSIAKTKTSVGIGIPGSISPKTNLVQNANSTWLIGTPLKLDLEILLGRPVLVDNDANCFTVSESLNGNGKNYKSVFGIILGTGVGAGLVLDKNLHRGTNYIAGEWGHNPIPWPNKDELAGNLCYCGKHGCIETFLSGPGLEHLYEKKTHKKLSVPQILFKAQEKNEPAETILKEFENRLARALAQVINILDPDVIVAGGGLSNMDRLYSNIPKIWKEYIFSNHTSTIFVKAKHGDSSGVRGAALLWDSKND